MTGFRTFLLWCILGLGWLQSFPAHAQEEILGEVEPGSTGNMLPIIINNISGDEPLKNVFAHLDDHTPELTDIKITPEVLPNIPPGGSGTFWVYFSVNEKTPPSGTASMAFILHMEGGRFDNPFRVAIVSIGSVPAPEVAAVEERAGECPPGEKVLWLQDVQWFPPTGSYKNKDIRHADDAPGFSYHSGKERWSVGFTKFPERIPLGSPIEIQGEAYVFRKFTIDPKYPNFFCRSYHRKPAAHFGLGAFSRHPGTTQLEGKFEGEQMKQPCPPNTTHQQTMRFKVSLTPVKETGNEKSMTYLYKHVSSVAGKGKTWKRDGSVAITWKTVGVPSKRKTRSSGLTFRLRMTFSRQIGQVRLHYQLAEEGKTCLAKVTPYRVAGN